MLRIAVLFLLLAARSPASACDCGPPFAVEEAVERAALVFYGHVTTSRLLTAGNFQGLREYEFEVFEWFKGPPAGGDRTVSVFTEQNGSACGISFDLMESVVVYAYDAASVPTPTALLQKLYMTGECTRTVSRWDDREEAKAELEALRLLNPLHRRK